MIYKAVVFASLLVASAFAGIYPQDPAKQKELWENFKRDHQKKYATWEEEFRRFTIFVENLKEADRRNAKEIKKGGTAVHGITFLSDLSQAEFESQYLTADAKQKIKGQEVEYTRPVGVTATLVDWTGVYTTPVKNQGQCGSCWAFSATEQIESDTIRTKGVTYELSPEQIVQCAHVAQGCNGGWTEVAYTYVKNAGGIATETAYPYTSYLGKTGTCSTSQITGNQVVTVDSYTSIVGGESSMATYVETTGPISVCLDASNWSSYTGGILSSCGNDVDHCVQAVGVLATTGGYWKIRNSWGTSWGEDGYIRLAYGENTCDITNDPTYTAVTLL